MCRAVPVLAAMLLLSTSAVRAQQSMQHLAAAAQTSVGAMYSLPFQDTIYGGAGPNHDATANVLNIQPVIPITVGDWNIISRTIAPLIYLPSLTTGHPRLPSSCRPLTTCCRQLADRDGPDA